MVNVFVRFSWELQLKQNMNGLGTKTFPVTIAALRSKILSGSVGGSLLEVSRDCVAESVNLTSLQEQNQ